MKIVHLEDFASNFDRIESGERFRALGEYVTYDRTGQELVVERAADAEVIFSNKTRFGEAEFSRLPKLRYIGIFATGWNVVDIAAATRHQVAVTNVPAYSSDSVAQLVFAHLFRFCRNVEKHARFDWSTSPDFCTVLSPQLELNHLTMGLVGFGAIARKVAAAAQVFGMRVVTFTRSPEKINMHGVDAVSFAELLRQSDVVSLHCPLNSASNQIMNAEAFAQMKPSAFLINTARGGLVDEAALADALEHGKIAGAGLDVLSVEPPPADHILLHRENCRITPHIAWATREARRRLIDCAYDNLIAWIQKNPRNLVTP